MLQWPARYPALLSRHDIPGMIAGASLLSKPAEEFDNDPTVEAIWAQKAFEHAEIYFNMLCSADPRLLQLTPLDDVIYLQFRRDFPSMKIDIINEDNMKGMLEKPKWRAFCDLFKDKVEDHSFGTLLRVDCKSEYSEQNTILVPRVQFYAVEIARNREGYNDGLRKAFRPVARESA